MKCLLCVMLGALLTLGACDNAASPLPAGRRVVLTRVERLATPEVQQSAVYRPTVWFDIDPQDPTAGRAAGFFLWVQTGAIDELVLRWRDRNTAQWTDLTPIAGSQTPALFDPTATEWRANHDLTPWLGTHQGIFWVSGSGANGERRIGVAVPESWLLRPALLELAAGRLPDGTAIGTTHIDLAREFFYLTAIGDSAMWGNGLRERQKFTTLVAERIERATGRKVVREVLAISGARIVPQEDDGVCVGLCRGEIPRAVRSVTTQLDFIQRPDVVDLLLVDGCANDVGLDMLLSVESDVDEIISRTQEFCGTRMADLLMMARERMPQATVVVTGYFPILSEQSDVSELEQWVTTLDVPVILDGDDLEAALNELTPNIMAFWETSTIALAGAVEALNAADPTGPLTRFADAGFDLENATFGPEPWLWGLTSNVDLTLFPNLNVQLQLFPEDPLLNERATDCAEPGVFHDYVPCVYSSVAHPNPAGAEAYANAIMVALTELGIAAEP